MKRYAAIAALCAVVVIALAGCGDPNTATLTNQGIVAVNQQKCYEQVTESQYKKFTAPTDAGPWVLHGTWWKGQEGAWWPGDAEVVEGPADHPLGRYTYRQVAERIVDGEEIPCPTIPPVVITPQVQYTPPTCTSIGTLTFPNASENFTVTNNGNGTYTFVPVSGKVFPEGFNATVGPFPLLQLVGEVCGTTTSSSSTTTSTTLPPCPDCTPNTVAVPGGSTTTLPVGGTIPPITNPASVTTTTAPPPGGTVPPITPSGTTTTTPGLPGTL